VIPALAGRPARERALFKDIPSTDPAREIVQTVLGSKFYSMREGFTATEWRRLGYGGAWERARRYFPANIYLVRPGAYFMAHGFDRDGRLFMEVHESDYLALCVANRRTFRPASVVDGYRRMFAAADGREAAAFREKMGRLEPYFRDEPSQRGLRRAVGEALYLRLLKELREEDYHMIAGGLMHEGSHAGLGDVLVARLQAEFGSGSRPVQWDELRASMTEIGYHARFRRWAVADMGGHWRRIEDLLRELEGLRNTAAIRSEADRSFLERSRTRAGAWAVLIRLRMRELWQSARRADDLAVGFRKDYARGSPSADIVSLFAGLDRETAEGLAASEEAIRATEVAVRSLEGFLETWEAWADGRRPFPAPVTDARDILDRVDDIRWPEPPREAVEALMRRASAELEKERTSL
jgi:hypothetical protein